MNSWKILVMALALAGSAIAIASDSSDPFIGSWTMNLAKSKYSKPSNAPRSETRSWEMTPEGMIHLHVEQVAADGTTITENSTYKRDGKTYPLTGLPNNDAIAVTQVSSHELRSTQLLKGKVVGHMTSVVSQDGKVLTMTITITTPAEGEQHNVRVYDKQ